MDEKTWLNHQLRLALAEIDFWRTTLANISGPDLDTGWLRHIIVEYQVSVLEIRIKELRSMLNA